MSVPSRSKGENYSAIQVSNNDIKIGKYKAHLGGGAEEWEQRGAAQLHFMKNVGLQPDSLLLDIGCGPGRAGRYFVQYLNANKYTGVDYNFDFIKVFAATIQQDDLSDKKPDIFPITDFNFKLSHAFNYLLAFSVLNHCDQHDRELFFKNVVSCMSVSSRLYLTHGQWFFDGYLLNSDLVLSKKFETDSFGVFSMWAPSENLFPILELRLKNPVDEREKFLF